MIIEGKGAIIPSPIVVPVLYKTVKRWEMIAQERYNRKYAESRGQWQQGLDPEGIFKGIWGEGATHQWFLSYHLPSVWNPGILPGGDDGIDLAVGGIKIQAKTGEPLIRRIDDRGRKLPLVCTIYQFCRIVEDVAHIDGWVFREKLEELEKRGLEKGKGPWWNIRVPRTVFLPPLQLI